MREQDFRLIQSQLQKVYNNSAFYAKKYKEVGLEPQDIKTEADFTKIPFTSKADLRSAYPLGLQASPDEEIVRIHSSSGTTGQPVIIPYTQKDVDDWELLMARCMNTAGLTPLDRVQITPGYGLWTAGIGFQAGVEKISAMAIPMGPGNTEKQLEMMVNLKSTVLISTSSYALLLAEQVAQRDIKDKICLKKGIIGSERWSSKMRQRICNELDIEAFDIYGLTEVYGPGISIDCTQHNGLHYWDDYLYFEIIDPNTAEVLPMGEEGELVITTLKKEGAPLIRYRTRDITRLIPGECACGMKYPRHDLIKGRSDDMIKIKGVNIFPTQIDEVLQAVEGVSSEYRVEINREDGKDIMLLIFEAEVLDRAMLLMEKVSETFKRKIGITIATRAVAIGDLPRSEKKTKRIIDNRY